ncbi:hypothetical protein CmeUKMEL1_12845 [Cryptosporidium meleagridis]|uniref:Uncharacterized protein n=1 Tax=Cryptosporidium meleagridis TaxID=93969 RepID=A0A2P4Z380_9CRYT|nr:hypothetical protein CmeUKMEL1_12845 [Cryptosporidium meleagridis]
MNSDIFVNRNNKKPRYVSISLNNDELAHFCPFLSNNDESILFKLSCNYLSLGQFELARSSILQLSLFNFRKVFELLSSIIYYGPPPDWQLSVTISTSTHFILACIREYESLFRNNAKIENYIIKRTEFDLLMGQMIADISDIRINFEIIKKLRNFYSVFLINGLDIKFPELKILPKIVGLPSYLNRFPSFSTNLNKLFENVLIDLVNNQEKHLSIKIINEMFECFNISRSYFIQIAKILIMDHSNALKFETSLLKDNSILKNTLFSTNVSLNWIVLKNCIIDLIFFKENCGIISLNSLGYMISKNISIVKLENIFENHDLEFTNFTYEKDVSSKNNFTRNKKPEDVISIIVMIFCIINLFCKYKLNKEIFLKFLADQIEILKSCEDICNRCIFESRIISNVKSLFSENLLKQLNNFQSINQYLNNINTVKLVGNDTYSDHIGTLVNSNSNQSLIFKIVLEFDNILFKINFGINNSLGIFSLPRYIENKNKVTLNPIITDDFSINYKFDEKPFFWCEYLRYLNLSGDKFEELPIIFITDLFEKIYKTKRNIKSFESANKISLCFPHLRAICVYLGMKNDPIFNWELLKNLWLPFRLISEDRESFVESKSLELDLDEISRRHAISVFISEELDSNFRSEFVYSSKKNIRKIFEEITLKKSIINYYFDNFNSSKNYTTINWVSLEAFISNIISLPLTIGTDISLLTKERDCIKSYLLQKEVFETIDGKGSSTFGFNLQNISIEIGNIHTEYFHNELIYCFFCQIFIYLKKIKVNNSIINTKNKKLFNITQLLYYLFIWSERLSRNFHVEMLPVIEKTFEKTILMIELILFSFPFNIPNVPLPKNLEIFSWWYRFILSTPSRVFNTGKTIIRSSKSSEYFQNLFKFRWIIRGIYENNPWYSNLFSFESYCVLNYYNNSTRNNYSEILLFPSILTLKLLSIQNYEKSIELILSSKFHVNITLIVLDGFIFYALFEEEEINNYYNINKIYGIIKSTKNERLTKLDLLNNKISLFSAIEVFCIYIQKKFIDYENEIGWIFYFFPKLYQAFVLIDLYICFGNKNSSNLFEDIGRARDMIEQYTNNLNIKYKSVVQTTLDRLFIFYQSSSTISLTRYIMEIDTLPNQTSQIKTHLSRIHDRKLMTTTLTQSLNYLSGFSLIKPQEESLININQNLEQSLFSNGNNSSYLFSVLQYIKSIISELFSNLDKHKAFPILALTPNEIISYSFFERKLKRGSKRLSRIMNVDLISVIIKALNCFYCSTSMLRNSEISSHNDMEFLIEQLDSFKGTFAILSHNILQSKDVQYSYFIWKFAVKNRINYHLEKKQIIIISLKYRIWKYDIHKQLESKIFNVNINKISGFFFSKSLEYYNYSLKWLSIIDTFLSLNYNLNLIMRKLNENIGFINYLLPIYSISRTNTVEKILFQLSRETLRNQNIIDPILNNFKRIIKLNSPYYLYKLLTGAQGISDPYFILSIIEIISKNTIKNSYSKIKNSKLNNFTNKFIEENIYVILNVQRLFCISYIKHFKNNSDIWNKWFNLIKKCETTEGIISMLKYSIEMNMFSVAKIISQQLLFKVIKCCDDVQYMEKELKNFFSGDNFFEEIRKDNNFSLISIVNYIIANIRDEEIFQKYNYIKLSKAVVSKWISSFENIIEFLNNNIGIDEKYIILDAYINSQNSSLDVNRINVLKTILTSIKLVKDLRMSNFQASNLFSPYLIIRMAIISRNTRLIEILKRDIDIFLKSGDVLLNLIEESFGIIDDKETLKEKIKKSYIFGQADINSCIKLFPIIENNINLCLNIEDIPSYNNDIYFSIKLISIIPKKKTMSDLLFSISNKLSNQLYKIFRNSISDNSLIRTRFECSNSQLWVAEEGSLKIIPNTLHPFSKFSKAKRNSYYTKNRCLNKYKSRLNINLEKSYNNKNEINMENISKLRILFRNLFVLLAWASDYIGKGEFSKSIKSLTYLFEIWQRNPALSFSLKDFVYISDYFILVLVFSDQIKILKDLSENNILETDKKSLDKNHERENLIICDIVANSIIISKISQYYNGKNDILNSTTLNASKSRNEMIMDIFYNKWKISRRKMTSIEILKGNTVRIIENLLFLKPDILNLSILIIILTYHSWGKLQMYISEKKKNILHFPLASVLNFKFFNSIFELYEQLFISNIKIRMNEIYTISDLVSNWKDFSVGIENNSDFFENSNDNLSLSYTTFFLERITNSIKKNLSLKNKKAIKMIKCIQVKKFNNIIIYYNQRKNNKKKFFQIEFINHLLIQSIPNHYFLINTFVKLNLWWELMVYILRWSYELGFSKSRSLLMEKRREIRTNSEKTFEEIFFDLVIKKAHSKGQLNSLINAMNEAIPLGGPRAAIVVKKCKNAIQKYLECSGALEMLYRFFLSLYISIEIPHALMGAIAIHLSLLDHLNIDSRTGYLESALYHFKNANLVLKKKVKSGVIKKNKQSSPSNCINYERAAEVPFLSQNFNIGKLNDVLIPFIADIPIYKINISPWGGLSLPIIQRIIRLVELQNSIIKLLIKENSSMSILSPNYKDRRNVIVFLFLIREYPLAFKTSNVLEIPLMEVLVHATRELIVSYPKSNSLYCFLDSMKLWLSEYDSDALISNAINMWISEKKINLNNIPEIEKNSIMELINRLSNPLSRSEAFNMINPLKKVD